MKESDKKKMLDQLSRSIVDALSNDKQVMKMLIELESKDIINSSTVLGLALKVNELKDISGMILSSNEDYDEWIEFAHESNLKDYPKDRGNDNLANKDNGELLIDGSSLTDQEARFQSFASANFDEKKWLRSFKLIW
ncbi:MAG: hypothetical protein ACN4E2_02240 [Nitrospinota bacterium]